MASRFTSLVCVALVVMSLATSTEGDRADWTTSCSSACQCRWTSGKRTAECVAANLTHLPHFGQPDAVQVLDVQRNSVSRLRREAFASLGMLNLQRIFLTHCSMKTIHSTAFEQLVLLVELDLSHNELVVLKCHTFRSNLRLKILRLQHNRLKTMPTFPSLQHLRLLDMAHNHLELFHFRLIESLDNLETLELHHNKLANLSLSENQLVIKSLSLHNNPWQCDCHLLRAFNILMERKIVSSQPAITCDNDEDDDESSMSLMLQISQCTDADLDVDYDEAVADEKGDTLVSASAADLLATTKSTVDVSAVFVFGVVVVLVLSVVLLTLTVATWRLLRPSRDAETGEDEEHWHADLGETNLENNETPTPDDEAHREEAITEIQGLSDNLRRQARLVWIVAKDSKRDVIV